jgi:ubiquinone/menaquinone biosynthesis C-methylase UbiE
MFRSLLRTFHKPIYEHRQQVLVKLISPHLKPGARVLDIGCGFGHLGRALMDASNGQVQVEGLESVARGNELIPITAYEGTRIPFPDGTFDAVIVADVLHHDHDQERLLREAARVSRDLVIIKDHLRDGALAQQRISFLDWAANAGYSVPCLYKYNNLKEWHALVGKVSSGIVEERTSVDVYPPVFNELLGKGLHYFVVFRAN